VRFEFASHKQHDTVEYKKERAIAAADPVHGNPCNVHLLATDDPFILTVRFISILIYSNIQDLARKTINNVNTIFRAYIFSLYFSFVAGSGKCSVNE